MLITKPEGVVKALQQLDGCEYFAFDTEFVRQTTFFPKLCLMQFASDKGAFAIDVTELMAGRGWSEMKEVLTKFFRETKSVVVMHAGDQDIEILNQQFVVPKMMFDTQLAARFIGFAGTPSYRIMVEHYFDVSLDKELQFSRWDRRPLSKDHIDYAIRDVSYLYKMYPLILEILSNSSKIQWFVEDMISLRNAAIVNKMDNISELRGIVINLPSPEVAESCYAVLRAREMVARINDVTKQRLLPIDAIEQGVVGGVLEINKLNVMPKFKQQFVEMFERIQKEKGEWEKEVAEAWANRFMLRQKKGDNFFVIKDLLAKVAQEVQVNPELIANSKDVFRLLQNKPSKVNYGWRYDVFGEKAMKLVQL